MKEIMKSGTRPNLKTRKFSTLHIEIFEQILLSGKTNRDLNIQFGYSLKSHCVVDHSRRVMYKLLMMEGLKREENIERVIYPRIYKFWWKQLLDKHRAVVFQKAVTALFYEQDKQSLVRAGNL